MVLKIDFNSDEANPYSSCAIRLSWASSRTTLREGGHPSSVRQMAEYVGINMHTVNKAYSVLRQEGFVKLDRRKGSG